MPEMFHEFRSKKVLKRIAEMKAMGLSDQGIADALNKELKLKHKATIDIIKSVWNMRSVKHKEFLDADIQYASLYKEMLLALIQEGKFNITNLNDTRKLLIDKLEKIKHEVPSSVLMSFAREIANLIKTQNDSLKTIGKSLVHFESLQKEVKVSQIQNVRVTMKALKSLEDQGIIKINPEFKNTELLEEDR